MNRRSRKVNSDFLKAGCETGLFSWKEFWISSKAFEADPVAISWGEVFTAIQQSTIDGQENGFSVISSTAYMRYRST